MPYCEAKRRAFARKSNMDNDGVSSIYKGAASKSFTLTLSCSHSCFSKLPVRSVSELKPVSEEIRRVINWTDDISNEKKATGTLWSMAIFLAMERVSAVFPIPGLAELIIKSLCYHPEVSLSSYVNQEGIPDKTSLFAISSIFLFTCK